MDTTTSIDQIKNNIGLLIERRRYGQATDLLSTALTQHPDDPELQFYSAQVDYLNGQEQRAYETLKHALVHSPTHFQARALMAQIQEDRNELPAAEALLIELLREYPQNAWLYTRYPMLMYRAFNIEKGQALAQEAIRLDPDCEIAMLAHILGKIIVGDRSAEKEKLSELIRKYPESRITAHILVTHLTRQGKYTAAKNIAIEVLRLQPDSRDALRLVVELDHASHWSMLPLWPLNRWGWTASGAFWLGSLVLLAMLRKEAPSIAEVATIDLLIFVAYSWIYPPLLKRWLMRRAGL